jgi:putative effector of murein hydrolase
MMFILVILIYLSLAVYELLPLYKQKFQRDFWASAVMLLFSFIVTFLLCFNIKMPSPETPIKEFITSILGK